MFGVRHVKLDPRNPTIVYATAFNNAIHRSAPSLESGDASFKPVFAIVGLQRFRDLAMFDLDGADGRTRMYVYNGTESAGDAGAVPAGQRRRAGRDAGDRAAAPAREHDRVDHALVGRARRSPASTSRRICGSQCFYDLVVAVAGRPARHGDRRRRRDADVRRADDSIDERRRDVLRRSARRAESRGIDSHVDVRVDRVSSARSGASRSSDRTAASCATTAASPNIAEPVHAAVRQRRAVPDGARRGADAALLPEQGPADDAVLQRRARSAGAAPRLIGGLQDNSTIWQDGTRRPAGLEDAVSVRRRHVGVGLSSDAAGRAVRELPEQQLFHELPRTAIRRAGCARTIRFVQRASATTITRVHRPAVHHVRSRATRHAVHRRFSTSGGRRTTAASQALLEANCRFPGGDAAVRRAATGCRSACVPVRRRAATRPRPAASPAI